MISFGKKLRKRARVVQYSSTRYPVCATRYVHVTDGGVYLVQALFSRGKTGFGGLQPIYQLEIGTSEDLPGHVHPKVLSWRAFKWTNPLGRFPMVDISTVGIVSVPKTSALKTSRRELSEGVWFGIGTSDPLLVVEQSSLETAPVGCDIHRPIR